MKKKILFILIIAISSLYSNSNNEKINILPTTSNEIIKPSDELLALLEKNKNKTGVAEMIELINEGGINASSKGRLL